MMACLIVLLMLAAGGRVSAESGYDLWLRYIPIEDASQREAYRKVLSALVVTLRSDTGRATAAELQRGLGGMLGTPPRVAQGVDADGTLVVGTPASSPLIASLGLGEALTRAGSEGYVIKSLTAGSLSGTGRSGATGTSRGAAGASTAAGGHAVTVIAAQGDVGALYGAFHLLRLIQTRQPVTGLDIVQRPRLARRLLNHWDNLDGSIERGYAGRSLWKWDELPAQIDPRVIDYARANASIGINGTAINSVNANPTSLTRPYLEKAAALANAMRPYGIRVYLSANFAAPRALGARTTADPLDPAVAQWWRDKATEIYNLIPDFGGFVVKANSEGQPGPQDYNRTHADGANVLADAVAPHGGIVMWRAFVYNQDVDPDRVKRASLEFVPLDGRFRENVFVQVKNGPLDFQPREPVHPLFGAMPRTPLMAELQITQEYLGHSTHLVYLAPLWKEFLDADTYTNGPGSTITRLIETDRTGNAANAGQPGSAGQPGTADKPGNAGTPGSASNPGKEGAARTARTGIVGVANTGSDRNWTGHHFGQANWYAYGRLAWNPDLDAADIADEWIGMTWDHAPLVAATIRAMMLDSHEAFVDYTMPLGLHHLIGGDHYAPMPENPDPRRADWSAIYYHRADATAVGFDRTRRGSAAVDQYRSPLREQWSDPATTPEPFLLWFHRLPWDYRLRSGRTLWDGLVFHYTRGATAARGLQARWTSLKGQVDDERYDAVLTKLRQQAADAAAWRDKCLRYFQQFSRRPY